ncbi:hypothetical protein KY389_03955 [Paracoccus bogoriensis]|uniref:hypothetical protein n=1 Tax=Paracoccus bogoriensis TaxID=242065 RepID=UPI001CA51911|nr:hypothetical protein [Paracoccus bogoriensis]MBW7055849.1 hypothetical protein [Paracoccus bogoriensis]
MISAMRLVLLLGVILGVVLPKTSVVLAGMGVVDSRTVLICTGHGLTEITLSIPGDTPQPPRDRHDLPCLLAHALDGCATPAIPPLWLELAATSAPVADHHLWRPAHAFHTGDARAPPRI